MNVLAFDIETIPDIEGGRKIYDLDALSDEDTARAMIAARRKPGNTGEFLPHHLQTGRRYLRRVAAVAIHLKSGRWVMLNRANRKSLPDSLKA